jgi:two-component system nitrogen regulation response regulator GlnG
MNNVLVIDDEPAICWSIREALSDRGFNVDSVGSIEQAWSRLETFEPGAIVLDVRLPGQDGLSALPDFRQRLPDVPVIVMTAFGDLPTAVAALGQQAFEYVTKPFNLAKFTETVERAVSQSRVTPERTQTEPITSALVGRGQAMQQVFREIALVAETDFPVLILGETGAGKDVVAREIHRYSRRARESFIPVCPAALSPALVESELFGHVRGAYTGAVEGRAGLFELADRGTLFLDEIAETPLEIQVKLLRVLESRQFRPVGSGLEKPTGARFIAATNRDLSKLVREGAFREDLLHRLKTFTIVVPPLRERREDIPLLVEHFLSLGPKELAPTGLDPSFLEEVQRRDWPGNVRELRHATERAVVLARGGLLRREHLPSPLESSEPGAQAGVDEELVQATIRWARAQMADGNLGDDSRLLARFLQLAEKGLLGEVLSAASQNRTLAARWLGLDRTTLRTKLKQLFGESVDTP